MSTPLNHDLDWLAFRYISDEMSADERDTFENQLAGDQPAREAVAAAVELSQTVAAAEHLVESPAVASVTRRAIWWRRVAWLAISGTAAACVGLAFALPAVWEVNVARYPSQDNRLQATNGQEPISEHLAAAWVETLGLDQQWQQESEESAETTAAQSPAFDLLVVGDDTPTAASNWMVTAFGRAGSRAARRRRVGELTMRFAAICTILLLFGPALLPAADPKDGSVAKPKSTADSQQNAAGTDAKNPNSNARATNAARQKPAAKAKRVPGVTRGREAAVLTFVRDHHPQLESLLVYLKKNRSDEYKQAFLELFAQSERLARIQELDEARYDLELAKWKVESRIKLLLARMQMDTNPELLEQLHGEVSEQVRLRIELMKSDRRRMLDRMEKFNQRLERLSANPEQEVQRQLRMLTSPRKATSKVSTKPAASEKAGGNRTVEDR